MARFLNSVATLTDLRDRDELEATLASVMYEFVGPSKLAIWRVVSFLGAIRVRQRVQIQSGSRVPVTDALAHARDLPELDSDPAFRACYDSKAPLRTKVDKDGRCRHIFPVTNGRHVLGFLEIGQSIPLREYQERLVCGLLRIYQNHLTVLDDSEYDQLTGLMNRKTFDERFRQLVAPRPSPKSSTAQFEFIRDDRPDAPDRQSWLAVCDIDYFKRINDDFGHLYGDEILVLLARLLTDNFREEDRIFRFGGEEFVVLFGRTTAADAMRMLERCRSAIEAFAFPQVGRVTVSIGFTCITSSDGGSDAFGRADRALYVAKQSGRNQVQSYEALVDRGVLSSKSLASGDLELF